MTAALASVGHCVGEDGVAADQPGQARTKDQIGDAARRGLIRLRRLAVGASAALRSIADRRTVTHRGGNVADTPGESGEAAATSQPLPVTVGELVREGNLVRLRTHVPANRTAFQRWYADEEIAGLLRHDQEPLNETQSRGYFDTIILPLSARGHSYAIHEASTDRLIGSTALTDVVLGIQSALFRIVIGEKDCWGKGYGTEATRLVVQEAFERHGLTRVRLEVFRHNERAIAAYRRVGFQVTGEHVEWVGRSRFELHVVEMALDRDAFVADHATGPEDATSADERPFGDEQQS